MNPAAAALVVVLAVAATWLPALDASFQFDDFNVIVRDARVHSLAAWWASMPAIRPLLRASYAIDHTLGGTAAGFRATNVAIHAANAALVLLLLRTLALRLGQTPRRALAVALIAALVFALHPAQTEAVTYLSGRSISLMALFALSAMLLWVRSFDAAQQTRASRAPLRRACALVLGVAALGVKESAVMLPVALLLWAWTIPAPDAASAGVRARQYRSVLAGAALAACAALALWLLTPYPDMIRAALARRSPWENLLTQAHAVPYLLGHLVDPRGLNADPDLQPVVSLDASTALRLLLLGGSVALGLALRRRAPAVAFGLLWSALWLLPTNSLFAREDLANDRQLYVAMIGPAWLLSLALVAGAEYVAKRAASRAGHAIAEALVVRTLVVALAAGIAGSLAWMTLERNRVYATEVSFWEDAASKSPRKARTLGNLGYAYALACRDAEAFTAFDRARVLDPHDFRATINRDLLARGMLFAPGERACEAGAAP